jgi:glycosyltransferase involved in cell wall biosynthesis
MLDILIPTCNRPAALAVTLTSLCAQTALLRRYRKGRHFRVVISDQTEESNPLESGEVIAACRVLQSHGHTIALHRHLPRRGIAEQRQFLLNQAIAPYVLYLDDDLILEPWVIETLLQTIQEEDCGFVGSAIIGLSFAADIRPHQQKIEFWQERVQPELITPDSAQWERYQLHNAANIYHVQQQLQITPTRSRKYRVAWIGGCVLYNAAKLRSVGGFEFWQELPEYHCGEDVLAQLRVMAKYGGCGVLPSGIYHQELPTTLPDRRHNAPHLLAISNY